MKILPTICHSKTKVSSKTRKCGVQLYEKVSSIKCAQAIETLFSGRTNERCTIKWIYISK